MGTAGATLRANAWLTGGRGRLGHEPDHGVELAQGSGRPHASSRGSAEAMNRAITSLQEAATRAVNCLCEVQRTKESESARVSATRTILEQAPQAVELGDIQERLSKLEQIAKSRNWREPDDQPNSAPAGAARNVNGHP
jgi:hypothetical protein